MALQIFDILLAQPTVADQAAGLIATLGSFAISALLIWVGYNLMKSGNRNEKTGVELMGLKINLESAAGGCCMLFAALILMKFYDRFYPK
ncbi:hypothetical protein QUA70_20225 [Microcoleus sp. LAD1_D5]